MGTARPRQALTGIVGSGIWRWLVAGAALRASARPQFEQALTAIGAMLGCPARLAG